MGIGTGQALLLRDLAERGAWKSIRTVCELGSQEPLAEELPDLFVLCDASPLKGTFSAKELYTHLGASHYTSIDINGEHNALCFDLNRNLRSEYGYHETFDLVTNFGTSEHCFNQYEVFRNIHHLCTRGGYMLHTVPAQGWGRHCFFRYDANFFEDLAAANGYEIMLLEPFLRLKPYLRQNKADTLHHVLVLCAFAESEIDKATSPGDMAPGIVRGMMNRPGVQLGSHEIQKALGCVGKEQALFNITLACMLKKNQAGEFASPIQGMYQSKTG
jgi:hypothetical protein